MDTPGYSKPRHQYGTPLSDGDPTEVSDEDWAGEGYGRLNEESACRG